MCKLVDQLLNTLLSVQGQSYIITKNNISLIKSAQTLAFALKCNNLKSLHHR